MSEHWFKFRGATHGTYAIRAHVIDGRVRTDRTVVSFRGGVLKKNDAELIEALPEIVKSLTEMVEVSDRNELRYLDACQRAEKLLARLGLPYDAASERAPERREEGEDRH